MLGRSFFGPSGSGYALFSDEVLSVMYRFAQVHPRDKEAGGELFSRAPNEPGLLIDRAILPKPQDARRRHYFGLEPREATRERERQAQQNLYPVGIWHTHPSAFPHPSSADRRSAGIHLKALMGDVDRYLLVTLGNRGDPLSMSVWVSTEQDWVEWREQPISRHS